MDYTGSIGVGNFDSVVRRSCIYDDNLVSKSPNALQTVSQILFFILDNHANRESWGGASMGYWVFVRHVNPISFDRNSLNKPQIFFCTDRARIISKISAIFFARMPLTFKRKWMRMD